MGKATAVVWLKRDLRVHDHPALEAALRYLQSVTESERQLLVLYVYEPELIQAFDFDSRHLQFINDCLKEVDLELRKRQQKLITQQGDMVSVLNHLHEKQLISRLFSHEEAGHQLTFSRDLRVKDWCKKRDIPWIEFPHNGVIRRMRNRDGWAYKW